MNQFQVYNADNIGKRVPMFLIRNVHSHCACVYVHMQKSIFCAHRLSVYDNVHS